MVITDITSKNKLKAFSSYLGSNLLIYEPNIEPVSHYLEGIDYYLGKVIAERVNYNPDWIKLILKPFKHIKDEEIIECCYMGYPLAFQGNNKKSKWTVTRSLQSFGDVKCKYSDFSFEFDLTGQPDIITMYNDDNLSSSFANMFVDDYLKSLGYDLPNWWLDGKTLEQSGLAIYKNKTYTDETKE